jgi:hypothetical protein
VPGDQKLHITERSPPDAAQYLVGIPGGENIGDHRYYGEIQLTREEHIRHLREFVDAAGGPNPSNRRRFRVPEMPRAEIE